MFFYPVKNEETRKRVRSQILDKYSNTQMYLNLVDFLKKVQKCGLDHEIPRYKREKICDGIIYATPPFIDGEFINDLGKMLFTTKDQEKLEFR